MIAIFCGRLRGGERPTVFGDGTQTRDYIYVGDVVAAALAAADSEATGPINVGTGIETDVLELAAAAGRAGRRRELRARVRPAPAPARCSGSRSTRPRRTRAGLAGRRPSLEEGLRLTLDSI